MAAGFPYFAWIDVGETTFTSGHMRWDEDIFSFTLKQDEGDPASLTIAVRRPRNTTGDPIGLLGPGRKIWCWFALDCGPALIKFRGRLVGIPTSLFEDLVTLEFVAKPVDLVAQKDALAASLRVLPFYDDAVIDPARATDPDVVLEGYTAVWHYDPEIHVISISDEITGDSTVSFDGSSEDGKVLYDGLALTLTSGPLARVDVNAEYTWTQQARGTVDLTRYLTRGWPNNQNGIIYSYSLTAGDWPKSGAGLGDGWVVAEATARNVFDFTVKSFTEGSTLVVKSPDGSTSSSTVTTTSSYVGTSIPHAPIAAGTILNDSVNISYAYEQDEFGFNPPYVSSFSRTITGTRGLYCLQGVEATLVAGYTAERQCTERVSFSLFADVQPILTDPEDGEALLINDVRSVNLSEEGQIGDPRRRSYIATARGNQSLEHLIALARAHLMKRARVIEIAFAPKLARMAEITLRKSAFLAEPRIGEALGKIIAYSIELDGSDGHVKCEVRIGCPIGRGGVAVATAGTPTYCTVDYTGHDYQQFAGRTVLVGSFDDTSVGYQPPISAPNDDGINFLSALSAQGVIEKPLVVTMGPGVAPDDPPGQRAVAITVSAGSTVQEKLAARQEFAKTVLKKYETHATFKLKSMTKSFETNYAIQVTNLQIPTGYNLEAV